MAKLTGLIKRSGVYHLRVMVPLDLRDAHHGRSKFIKTLNTTDYRDAALKGAHLRAQWLARFDAIRKKNDPTPVTSSEAALPLPLSGPVAVPPAKTLRHVFNQWKKTGDRSTDSVQACERALKAFEDCEGSPSVAAINYDHGARFRKTLLAKNISQKTARDYFVWAQALLRFAQMDMGVIARNPWSRLTIEKPKDTPRRPWHIDELQRLFSLPLFTAYELPTDPKAGKDAAYWIPLLGLFMGARVSELAQLTRGDIFIKDGKAYLTITDEGDAQRLKTIHSKRVLPLHPELERLGLLSYLKALGGSSSESLWPSLPLRKEKPGGYFSQWFGGLRKDIGLGKYPDFHCFRHTVRTQLAEARFPESVKDRITGHGVKGSIGTQTYEHTDSLIAQAIQAIKYPALRLPTIYGPTEIRG